MTELEEKLAQYAATNGRARGEREKRIARSPDDARQRRAKSTRTKQLNLLIRPELHKALVMASHEQDISMTDVLEAAIEAYLKKGYGRA